MFYFFRMLFKNLQPLAISRNIIILTQVRSLQYIPIETKNKIATGHKITQLIERKRIVYANKVHEKEEILRYRTQNNLIIKCKNSTFDHYYGQHYGKDFNERFYASKGWRNRHDDYFIVNAFGPHPALVEEDKKRSFEEMNLNENMINTLKTKFNAQMPTKIQALSIDKIRSHLIHHLIAAETGCGKTLAYVIPLIEEIIKYKNENKVDKRAFNEPLGLVIVPTRELAFQLYEVLQKFINEELNFRVVLDISSDKVLSKEILTDTIIDSKLDDSSNLPPDIIITMPSRLISQFKSKRNYISSSYLRKLVIDEANLLLDDSNNYYILKILNQLEVNLQPSNEEGTLSDTNTQLLFVSATIPRDMKNILESILDVSNELETISTNRVNKIMMHVPQHFIRTKNTRKTEILLEIAKKNVNDSIMIFSNRSTTAAFVHRLLIENDVKCCLFNKEMDESQRDLSVQKFFDGECNIISCTDIASRGLDTLHVKHVINYEMPTFIADYVHRIGRVGRFGTPIKGAKVTNLITKAFEVDTVWNIEHSIRKGVDLDNLNANIKRILKHKHTPKNKETVKNVREDLQQENNEFDESENENEK